MGYYLRNAYLNRVALAVALDFLCLAIAATSTWFAIDPPYHPAGYVAATSLAWAVLFVVLYYTDAYGLTALGSGRSTLQSVLVTMGIVSGVAGLVYFAVPTPARALETATHVAARFFPLLLAGRLGFRLLLSLPGVGERLVIVGTSDLARALARAVRERRNLGTQVLGFLSDDLDDQGAWIEGYPVLGKVHELEKVLKHNTVHRIVVASKRREEHFPADTLMAAKLAGLRVEAGVSLYESVTGRIYLRDLRPSYLVFSSGFRNRWLYRALKRLIDLAVAFVGLVSASWFLGLCAAAVWLDSRGPVFFSQERVGLGGRHFRVWKLRTMVVDRENAGPVWTAHDDERITRVGRLLRRARIDELPQLWNVLNGDMSLVGPRPEQPPVVATLSERYPYFRYRAAVKPGITGWAQVRFGYVNDAELFEEKLALDLYYLKYQSLAMDLLILWTTLKTVVLMRGL